MVTLVGTGHVFNLRQRVQDEIYRRLPTAVALELDAPRFQALQRPKDARRKGPFLYQMFADFQQRVAKSYGVEAGDEMLAAAEAARNLGVPVALIDRDAQVTFRRLFQEMRLGEKVRLLGSAVGSIFVPSRTIEAEVSEMEKDYSTYFDVLAKKFPTVKRVLLDERNAHMAAAIRDLSASHPNLVVVMGDGHVDGIAQMLSGWAIEVDTVRLKDLRKTAAGPGGTASATVTFTTDLR